MGTPPGLMNSPARGVTESSRMTELPGPLLCCRFNYLSGPPDLICPAALFQQVEEYCSDLGCLDGNEQVSRAINKCQIANQRDPLWGRGWEGGESPFWESPESLPLEPGSSSDPAHTFCSRGFADILDVQTRKCEFKSCVSSASLEPWGKVSVCQVETGGMWWGGQLFSFSSFGEHESKSKLKTPIYQSL